MTQGNREKQHRWDNPVRKRGAAARALQQREHRQRVVPDKRDIMRRMNLAKDMLDANATGEEIVAAMDPDWRDE